LLSKRVKSFCSRSATGGPDFAVTTTSRSILDSGANVGGTFCCANSILTQSRGLSRTTPMLARIVMASLHQGCAVSTTQRLLTGRYRPSSTRVGCAAAGLSSHSSDEGSVSQSFESKTDYPSRMASHQSARRGQGKTEFSFGWVADLNSRQSEQGSPPTLPLPPGPLRQAPGPQSLPRPSVFAGWPWCGSPRRRWYFVPRPAFS
jgi:hypothetical protein